MKAVVFRGPGEVVVQDVIEPQIFEPADALVRVHLAAISGRSVRSYTGSAPQQPNTTLGFEFVGEVVDVGSAVSRFEPGQRVVSAPSVYCGGCLYCKQGLLGACENRQSFGAELPGAQAELVRVPSADSTLELVPETLTDRQAIFAANGLTAPFDALQMAGVGAGYSVAVLGCGPTGLAAQLLARTMGAGKVIAVDHHDYRLRVAHEMGCEALNFGHVDVARRVQELTNGRGADVVVEAVGSATALAEAVQLARPWGKVVSLGDDIEAEASFPVGELTRKHVTLIPDSLPAVKNQMAAVLQMLRRGVVDPSPIASHTLDLDDAPRGYEIMAKREDGALKVLLRP